MEKGNMFSNLLKALTGSNDTASMSQNRNATGENTTDDDDVDYDESLENENVYDNNLLD